MPIPYMDGMGYAPWKNEWLEAQKMEVCFRGFSFFNWVICRFCWFIFRGVMGPIFDWIKQSLQGTVVYDGITISGKGYNNPCKFPCGNVPLEREREISSTRVLI